MAKRPAGLRAMMRAFETYTTDPELLRRCAFPVYLAYGLLTHEWMIRRMQALAGLLPDVWIEAYPGLHHFAPPQRSRPAHYAASLRHLWARAETGPAGAGPRRPRLRGARPNRFVPKPRGMAQSANGPPHARCTDPRTCPCAASGCNGAPDRT